MATGEFSQKVGFGTLSNVLGFLIVVNDACSLVAVV